MEINGIPSSISNDNLESTVINVLSKATNVHVTELINPREIQRKLLLALFTGNIANIH